MPIPNKIFNGLLTRISSDPDTDLRLFDPSRNRVWVELMQGLLIKLEVVSYSDLFKIRVFASSDPIILEHGIYLNYFFLDGEVIKHICVQDTVENNVRKIEIKRWGRIGVSEPDAESLYHAINLCTLHRQPAQHFIRELKSETGPLTKLIQYLSKGEVSQLDRFLPELVKKQISGFESCAKTGQDFSPIFFARSAEKIMGVTSISQIFLMRHDNVIVLGTLARQKQKETLSISGKITISTDVFVNLANGDKEISIGDFIEAEKEIK